MNPILLQIKRTRSRGIDSLSSIPALHPHSSGNRTTTSVPSDGAPGSFFINVNHKYKIILLTNIFLFQYSSAQQHHEHGHKKMMPLSRIHTTVMIALFAALIAAGALFSLPIGSVPFSLQPVFILLAGLCLGPRAGGTAVALYVIAGLIGLPVFVGGKSGLGVLLGPTGGFLLGFIGGGALAGLGGGSRADVEKPVWLAITGLVLAVLCIYLFGVAGLMFSMHLSLFKAIAIGVIPFLPGEVIKAILAFLIWRFMRRKGMLR